MMRISTILKKITMILAKALARKKQEFVNNNGLKDELDATMVFMVKMNNALSDSDESSVTLALFLRLEYSNLVVFGRRCICLFDLAACHLAEVLVESLQPVETLQWENILTVGSSSNSGNHSTNSGNPLAFYSQQSSPKLDTSPSYQVSRIK
ncbi:hypothetical protein Tco_0975990 [Tanacetum coccineum]|uniref:Uncharacterized protein n=1 Tax=Tanacetum coccineum TaxID=301880 RepID=A0ABQ5EFY3_9ASTR